MKVLSADDSSIMRKIIGSAVGRLGYEFLEAEDGNKAIDLLTMYHKDIALVLLDWNMPIKDGFQTLQEIKKDARFKHIPVMMVTTESEKNNIIKAIQSGASHYLTKPFAQEDLLTKMMECLGMGEFSM